MLGCTTLTKRHINITNITEADLRNPPGPNQCWATAGRHT